MSCRGGASLHEVTAVPAEYKGGNALKIEFTEAANKGPPGVDLLFDMPTFVLIPGNFKNGTIEVDVLGRLNGKGLPDARAFVGLAYRVVDGGARALNRSICVHSMAEGQTLPPRATSARSSTSPIPTGNSTGCAGNTQTGAMRLGPILQTTNGSGSSSISTTRASEYR